MFIVSKHILKLLAALVWHIGGFILLVKTSSLLAEAKALNSQQGWVWAVIFAGLCFGGIKAHLLFIKSCRKNLLRIDRLSQPKLWQFFTPHFFAALAVMIAAGAVLSRLAHGNFSFLIAVAILDLSISAALLSSSIVFWQQLVLLKPIQPQPFD